MDKAVLNLFYSEPDPDRWFKYDRYPRKIIRRILRGKSRPGGVMMIALNLMKGLDRLGVKYRYNDYKHIKNHPDEIACIIGKPHLLFEHDWENPIVFGAGVFSHPVDYPDLLTQFPHIKRILVPGEWMQKMFEPYYNDSVRSWPVGVDTDFWFALKKQKPEVDFLIYDKISLNGDERYKDELITPLCNILDNSSLSYTFIKYGHYTRDDLATKLAICKGAIFLSKSETQGLAYQQILATNTPILAWDKGGYWEDSQYYPHRVQYQPISSVPYWDDRCGRKFTGVNDFEEQLVVFQREFKAFKPAEYIADNLTLEICARRYLDIVDEVKAEIKRTVEY